MRQTRVAVRTGTAGLLLVALMLGVVACRGSDGSGRRAVSAQDPADTSTTTDPAIGAEGDAEACASVQELIDESTTSSEETGTKPPTLEELERGRDRLPAELLPALDAIEQLVSNPDLIASLDQSGSVEPSSARSDTPWTMPSVAERSERADALMRFLRAGYAFDTWWRHHCAPAPAASSWCDTISEAEIERAQRGFDALAGAVDVSGMIGSIRALGEIDERFYLRLKDVAPDDLLAPIGVIVATVRARAAGEEVGEAVEQASDDAQAALHDGIARDCGETLANFD